VGQPDASYGRDQHREAFLKFADFVKGNLNGQTSIRVDGTWASQSEVIKGFADFSLPDVIIREESLTEDLDRLGASVGVSAIAVPAQRDDGPYTLADIYDEEVEDAVRAAYQRDYMMFGFKPWSQI
jgi:hypothetical protein